MPYWYVDSSAAIKLVVVEGESEALRRFLTTRDWLISDLHRTELLRATARVGPDAVARAKSLIERSDVLSIDASTFEEAGSALPQGLRSLDAIHLAAALRLGKDLAGIVAYDQRLLEAAQLAGIETAAPAD